MPNNKRTRGQKSGEQDDSDFDSRWEKQAKVSFRVQLPKDTLDLLRDVSLARAIYDLAASVKVNKRGGKFRQPSVSKVIAEMVEERRTALEREVEIVRGITQNKKNKVGSEQEDTGH
ncbi:MAG: hypothetical protein MI741_10950 [Rhodospirillales bacterium]|nr:hypothetical protein [Rhodospirillales bacterium]